MLFFFIGIFSLCFLFYDGCLACDCKVELKKQSSCSMQLTNKTDQYVAFKVAFLLFHFISFYILDRGSGVVLHVNLIYVG